MNVLPIIPEKGDPSLALQELGKIQPVPPKNNRYPSQYESTKGIHSGQQNVFQEKAKELVKSSPYSKLLPDYQRGDYTAINGNFDARRLTVDPKLAQIDK